MHFLVGLPLYVICNVIVFIMLFIMPMFVAPYILTDFHFNTHVPHPDDGIVGIVSCFSAIVVVMFECITFIDTHIDVSAAQGALCTAYSVAANFMVIWAATYSDKQRVFCMLHIGMNVFFVAAAIFVMYKLSKAQKHNIRKEHVNDHHIPVPRIIHVRRVLRASRTFMHNIARM